jgi:hypothetical protein
MVECRKRFHLLLTLVSQAPWNIECPSVTFVCLAVDDDLLLLVVYKHQQVAHRALVQCQLAGWVKQGVVLAGPREREGMRRRMCARLLLQGSGWACGRGTV